MSDRRPREREPDPQAPHNLEAEMTVLGTILTDNKVMAEAGLHLEPGDFWEPVHRRIWAAMADMLAHGLDVTASVLRHRFEREGVLEQVGGSAYLSELWTCGGDLAEALTAAQVVHDLARRRAVLDVLESMRKGLTEDFDVAHDATYHVGDGLKTLLAVAQPQDSAQAASMADLADKALDAMQERWQRHGEGTPDPEAVTTGLSKLDDLTGMLRPNELTLLAARPSMGKTAVALAIATAAAAQFAGDGSNRRVRVFSMEMGKQELMERIYSAASYDPSLQPAGVPYSHIRRGRMSEAEFTRVIEARPKVERLPLDIDDRPGLEIGQVAASCLAAHQKQRLGLVVVDYLGIMRLSHRWGQNIVAAIGEVSSGLKGLSKQLGCPVLALAQLNRDVEKRPDKRPMLSDLRDSGNLEQDADQVLFLYREAYYLERKLKEQSQQDAETIDALEKLRQVRFDLEVDAAKNRHGPSGRIKLWCDIPCNIVRDDDPAASVGLTPQGALDLQ